MARQSQNSPDEPQERGAWDEALESEQVASLNAALRRLTDTPGATPEMKAMAKKLLSGQVSLRDIVDDPDGSRALGSGLASLRGKWEALSEEDRDRFRAGEPLSGDGEGRSESESEGGGRGADDSHGSRGSHGSGGSGDSRGRDGGKKDGGRHSGGFSLY